MYKAKICCTCLFLKQKVRAVDLHSFFADPNPAALLNAVPDPAAFLMLIRHKHKQICKNYSMTTFLELKKTK